MIIRTLADAVMQGAEDEQLAIAYLHSDGSVEHISRAQLAHHAQAIAHALAHKGVTAGDLLIIAHTQSLASIYAFWGAILIGAIPVCVKDNETTS